MNLRPADLPDFSNPPLIEVVLSLQFEPIEALTSPMVGVLWNRFRETFPKIEEHPPLAEAFETFGPSTSPRFNVVFEEKPPLPRVWFLSPDKSELIQIQQNRFIHNWRKVTGSERYPRYETIREKFSQEVQQLILFLKEEQLASLKINQCEVTYVNHIEPEQWQRHGQAGLVMRNWLDSAGVEFLPEPEDVVLRIRYLIEEAGEPIGRLNVIFQPAMKSKDNSPIFTLNLTARGRPIGTDVEAAFRFFDLGRVWIVKGFADLTSKDLQHYVWGKK